jgi:YD repeat-containing protein
MRTVEGNALAVLAVAVLCAASSAAQAQQYTYDSVGRVLTVTYPNGATISYTYDRAGNRVTETTAVGVGPASTRTRVFEPAAQSGSTTPPAVRLPARTTGTEPGRGGDGLTPRGEARIDRQQ